MKKILEILENDSTLTAEQIAVMLGKNVVEVKDAIEEYKKNMFQLLEKPGY